MADLDRLLREQNPEPGQPRIPVPQYQKIDGLGYEKVTGQHGGAHAVLLSPDGQPINSGNRLPVDTGLTNNLQIIADNQGRLYGSPDGGSTWKAVKVNSGGQLELAQNVVIDNVTVNVGAEVKVNNTPEDPVNVQLSGTIVPIILMQSTPVITAGSTITEITDVDYSMYREIMVVMGSVSANGGSFEVQYNDIHARRFSNRKLVSIPSEEATPRRYFVDWHRPITPMFNLMVTNKSTVDERFEYGIMGRM